MIVKYDNNPKKSIDEKMISLCENINLALNEISMQIPKNEDIMRMVKEELDKRETE